MKAEAADEGSASVVERPLDLSPRPSIQRMISLLRKDLATEDFEKSLAAGARATPSDPRQRGRRRPHGEGADDGHCDSSSSSRSSKVSNPASNSSRL